MTAQITDSCAHRGEAHSIVGIKGEGLFDPAAFGIRCTMMTTACWRGYYAGYTVTDGELRLASLHLQLDGWKDAFRAERPDKQPVVHVLGAAPTSVSDFGSVSYERIDARIDFTGGLLLGRDFIEKPYLHMGLHPAWKYRVVHELIFEAGRLVREADRSTATAEIRARLAAKPLGPNAANDAEVMAWIRSTFDQSYF